jgi:hypothetical protein
MKEVIVSSLLVPYSRTDVGFKIAFPQRGDSGRVSTKESIHESRLEGESIARRTGLQELLPDEVREIAHRTRSITPALASLDRLQVAIEDQRLYTPAALLLMSVPTEKVGKVCSFDSLRLTIDTRALGAQATCDL